jgi:small GTP-binding protein
VNNSTTVIQKKICMLGDFAVGKTSLVRRFVEGRFDDRYLSTIGVKISRRAVELSQYPSIHLLVWDLAGSEEFTGLQTSYLQGASGALLVCDLTRAATCDTLESYAGRLRQVNARVMMIIAGNKADMVEQRVVSDEQLAKLAGKLGATSFLTSAKTGDGVEQAFQSLTRSILGNK